MALTRDQLGDLRDDRVRPLALPGAADRPGPPGRRPTFGDWARQTGAVSDRWRQRLSEAWVVVFTGAVMLEPAAADPQAAEPLWAVGLFLALAAALVAMSVGLA
ncbi:MAG: hypothetical protein ACRDY5_07505, partial [Acidimicrobiales bacterium]